MGTDFVMIVIMIMIMIMIDKREFSDRALYS